jgi:hypothetical protein
MPTTDTDRRLAFLLHADDDRDNGRAIAGFTTYLILRAELVHLTPAGEVRNILDSDDAGLASLQVRGQTTLHTSDAGRTYGWGYAYDQPYQVDLDRARAMVATLGRLERRLAKLNERLGYPESFGAYLLRVAEVLGVRDFVIWDTDHQTGRRSAHGPREVPGTVAVDWYATRVRKFHDSATPNEESA